MNRTPSPRRAPRGFALAGAVLLAALAGGCGDRICPVEGRVVWKDGQPAKELEGALVVFDLPERKTNSHGVVLADGTFRLTTRKTGDGALAGEYKVVIIERRTAAGGDDPSAMAPGLMDTRYSDAATTDLRATIKRGTNQVTLTVERAQR